jgi:hypothetical protein
MASRNHHEIRTGGELAGAGLFYLVYIEATFPWPDLDWAVTLSDQIVQIFDLLILES